jgi:hypothetical protein
MKAAGQCGVILQARCGNGRGPCRINFVFPEGTEEIPIRYACYLANCKSDHEHEGTFTDHYGEHGIYTGAIHYKDAAPRLVWCLAHKQMMEFRKLRTARSSDACSADCTHAEGDSCKCSCGGLNHGIEA